MESQYNSSILDSEVIIKVFLFVAEMFLKASGIAMHEGDISRLDSSLCPAVVIICLYKVFACYLNSPVDPLNAPCGDKRMVKISEVCLLPGEGCNLNL